jgi:hypothetical protein
VLWSPLVKRGHAETTSERPKTATLLSLSAPPSLGNPLRPSRGAIAECRFFAHRDKLRCRTNLAAVGGGRCLDRITPLGS